MAQYLLLLHEDPTDFANLGPEEMQKVIQEYQAWATSLATRGHLEVSHKLKDGSGRMLARGGNGAIVDGPFSETKEVIGGFFLIQAQDYNQAAALCQDCPHLTYGGRIEVREIDPV